MHHPREVREGGAGVVTPEVRKELRSIFVYCQELAAADDDLDGEHFSESQGVGVDPPRLPMRHSL